MQSECCVLCCAHNPRTFTELYMAVAFAVLAVQFLVSLWGGVGRAGGVGSCDARSSLVSSPLASILLTSIRLCLSPSLPLFLSLSLSLSLYIYISPLKPPAWWLRARLLPAAVLRCVQPRRRLRQCVDRLDPLDDRPGGLDECLCRRLRLLYARPGHCSGGFAGRVHHRPQTSLLA